MMFLAIVVLVISLMLLLFFYKAAKDTKKGVTKAADKIIEKVSNPSEIAVGTGLFFISSIIKKLRQIIPRND